MPETPSWTQETFVAVNGGRGFLVDARCGVVVVTAAHCLPHLPPAHSASLPDERTYEDLLGPLGAERTVSAECLFVDPVADIAVLGAPDDGEPWDAYHRLVDDRRTLSIGTAAKEPGPAWLLTLSGQWTSCTVKLNRLGSALSLSDATKDATNRGASGSAIMAADGRALGVISGGPGPMALNPTLAGCLPPWLFVDLIKPSPRRRPTTRP